MNFCNAKGANVNANGRECENANDAYGCECERENSNSPLFVHPMLLCAYVVKEKSYHRRHIET